MKKKLLLLAIMFGVNCTSFSQNGVDMTIKKIKVLMKESSVEVGTTNRTNNSPSVYFNRIEKILDIDGYQIPLLEVKIVYYFSEKFKNHCVSFDCKGVKCISILGEYSAVFSMPFISKEKCYELIELINQLNK